MTKRYEITGVKVSFGPGAVLGLTDKQAEARLQSLKKINGDRYTVTGIVEFKRGEIVAIESDPPKGLAGKLALIEDEKSEEKKTPPAEYSLHHKGGGRYEVVDAEGKVVSKKLLTKDEANAFLRKLSEEVGQ
ncbi:MAG: hypothetical protein AB7H77_03855 [Bdellovibrionales bacterium]